MNDWLTRSEEVAGLIIENRLSLNNVRPEQFCGEYKKLIEYMKNGVIEPEELVDKVGLNPFQSAIEASRSINGVGDMVDWVKLLEQSALNYDVGSKLEKLGRKLQQGDNVEWATVKDTVLKIEDGISTDYTSLSDINSGEVKFIKSGWFPFDEHIYVTSLQFCRYS